VTTILHIGPGRKKDCFIWSSTAYLNKLLITCPMDSGEEF
jgi:hypothetical protein